MNVLLLHAYYTSGGTTYLGIAMASPAATGCGVSIPSWVKSCADRESGIVLYDQKHVVERPSTRIPVKIYLRLVGHR